MDRRVDSRDGWFAIIGSIYAPKNWIDSQSIGVSACVIGADDYVLRTIDYSNAVTVNIRDIHQIVHGVDCNRLWMLANVQRRQRFALYSVDYAYRFIAVIHYVYPVRQRIGYNGARN